jgi:hypothetical protein
MGASPSATGLSRAEPADRSEESCPFLETFFQRCRIKLAVSALSGFDPLRWVLACDYQSCMVD